MKQGRLMENVTISKHTCILYYNRVPQHEFSYRHNLVWYLFCKHLTNYETFAWFFSFSHKIRVICLKDCYCYCYVKTEKKTKSSTYNKHLMIGPEGNSEFCFPRISMFPSTSFRETLRFSGNKIHCFLWDQLLSDLLCSKTKQKANFEKRAEIPGTTSGHLQLHALVTCNSGQYLAGNSELFPVWRHSFRNVAHSWHLAGNRFIVRCHVTMN